MAEHSKPNRNDAISSSTNESSLDFAYEYIQETESNIESDIRSSDTKFTAIIAFSGLLLRFASQLQGAHSGWQDLNNWSHCEAYLVESKFVCCYYIILSILSCLYGLVPRKTGNIPRPIKVLESVNKLPAEEIKRQVSQRRAVALEEYAENRNRRGSVFIASTHILSLAIFAFAFNVILSSICGPAT